MTCSKCLNVDVMAGWTATKFRRWRFSGVADATGAVMVDTGSADGGVPKGQAWVWDRWGSWCSAAPAGLAMAMWLGPRGDRRVVDFSVAPALDIGTGPLVIMEQEYVTVDVTGATVGSSFMFHAQGRQLEPCADCTCTTAPDAVVELLRTAALGGQVPRAPSPDRSRPYDGYSLGPDEDRVLADPNWSPKRYAHPDPQPEIHTVERDPAEDWRYEQLPGATNR